MTAADDIQVLALEHADALGRLIRDELSKPALVGHDGRAGLFGDGYMLAGAATMRQRLASAAASSDQSEQLLAGVDVLHSVLYRVWERAKHDAADDRAHPGHDDRYALLPALLDTLTSIKAYLQPDDPDQ